MNTETPLAFAHPEARAQATSGSAMLDRLSVRDHVVEVEIGAFQAERGTTQRLSFNVVVEIQPLPADLDDDVDRILSYDRVTEAITFELAAERLNLLETLAERIAERILLEPQAVRVFVRIEKLDRGPGKLGVEIMRAAADTPGEEVAEEVTAAEAPQPQFLFLSNAAIDSDHLSGWIDQLEAKDAPLILCVDLPRETRPTTGHSWTQRRVDLLAIEQNAWRLAARDERCVVVATRTELDWAMKNGQICVWAPSKIVLDSPEGPARDADPVTLAAWFASHFSPASETNSKAVEVMITGAAQPATDYGLTLHYASEEQKTL